MLLDQLNSAVRKKGLSIIFRQHKTAEETIFYPTTDNFAVDESTWKHMVHSERLPIKLVKNTRTQPFSFPTGQSHPPYYFVEIHATTLPSRLSLGVRAVVFLILAMSVLFVAMIKKPV